MNDEQQGFLAWKTAMMRPLTDDENTLADAAGMHSDGRSFIGLKAYLELLREKAEERRAPARAVVRAPKEWCPECHHKRALDRKGRLREHRKRIGGSWGICPGSHKPPT